MNQEYTVRQMILQMINICTRVVTCIFAISTLTMMIFGIGGFTGYGITDVWCIILIGVVSGIGFGIFYIPKKIGKLLMFFMELFYFAIINITVICIAAKMHWYNPADKASTIVMEGMVVLVFILVTVLCYVFDYHDATKMNYLLKMRKMRSGEE